MSAEVLRRAAALMRERAEAATAGPWETYENMHAEVFVSEIDRRGFGVISQPAIGRDDYGKANADHIASWHPDVALAVADWLDFVAEGREALDGLATAQGYPTGQGSALFRDSEKRALTVARAYLGESA